MAKTTPKAKLYSNVPPPDQLVYDLLRRNEYNKVIYRKTVRGPTGTYVEMQVQKDNQIDNVFDTIHVGVRAGVDEVVGRLVERDVPVVMAKRNPGSFSIDYVAPEDFSKKSWYEPMRPGTRWFYHRPRSHAKKVDAGVLAESLDDSVVAVVREAGRKGIQTLPSCAGHPYDPEYAKKLKQQLRDDAEAVRSVKGLRLRDTETGQVHVWKDPMYFVDENTLTEIDNSLRASNNKGWISFTGDPTRLERWREGMQEIPFAKATRRGARLDVEIEAPNTRAQRRAWASAAEVARINPSKSSDTEANRKQIEKWLSNPPSDWKMEFRGGVADLKATGQAAQELPMTVDNALKILGITAGGKKSNDSASGSNAVPDAVREAAMKGLELSYRNNYGAWNFIGIARAIQLATQPGVPAETKSRMRNYFSRHRKDKESLNFGSNSRPSRGYMAWLNWGGDAGQQWVSGGRARNNTVVLNPDEIDYKGRLIPEKYLAGLPPELREQRIKELGESRDQYAQGDFSELQTDVIARKMNLVKLSPYRKVAMRRGFDISQAPGRDISVVAKKALKYYLGHQPSESDVSKLTEGLKKVYAKGLAAWKSGGHRPGATARNWADARIASVLVGGKAAWTADKGQFALLPAKAQARVKAEIAEVEEAMRGRR